jgi:hypothetical protein
MSAKPDKYPACPPGVNPFEWILRTAEQLRRRQAHLMDIERSRQAAQRREALRTVAREEVKSGPRPAGQYWRSAD